MAKSIIGELLQKTVFEGSVDEKIIKIKMRETIGNMKNFASKVVSEVANKTEFPTDDSLLFDDGVELSWEGSSSERALFTFHKSPMQLSCKFLSEDKWQLLTSISKTAASNKKVLEPFAFTCGCARRGGVDCPENFYYKFLAPKEIGDYIDEYGEVSERNNFESLDLESNMLGEMYRRAKEYFTILYKDKISNEIFNFIMDDNAMLEQQNFVQRRERYL